MEEMQPLDLDVSSKNLRYRSTEKINSFLLDGEKRILSGGSPLGLSMTFDNRPKTDRELLSDIGRLLQDQGIVTYEVNATPQKYLLLRGLCTAGTMWPSFGDRRAYHAVAYWLGRSARYQVFAYGNRKHLLHGNSFSGSDTVATWMPSIHGAYQALLDEIVDKSSHDQDLSPDVQRTRKVTKLISHYFDDGVQRASPLLEKGLYELLLRVDGVDQTEDDLPVVYGSPLWVAQCFDPVPGTYLIDTSEIDGLNAVAEWGPGGWGAVRWIDCRQRKGPTPSPPSVPDGPPSVSDLRTL